MCRRSREWSAHDAGTLSVLCEGKYIGRWWSRTIVSNVVLVQHSARTLTSHICYPYTSNAEAILVGEAEDLVPHWLIHFLYESSI